MIDLRNGAELMEPTHRQLSEGTYIDSHWGHYQSTRIIELARDLGYKDSLLDDLNLDQLLDAYGDHGNEDAHLHVDHIKPGNGMTVDEWVYETAREAEDWINDNCVPEGYWFGHHPDLGDVGVWPVEDE